MVRGVSKELENEIHRVLEESVNARPGNFIPNPQGIDRLRYDAILYLEDVGAFEQTRSGSFRLTAHGREYWDRLNTWTPWYWFKQNWFPAIVAAGTILFSAAAAAANIVNLVV